MVGNDEWKAIYHIEVGLNQENDAFRDVITRRYAYAGIQSARYVTVKYGTMATPYKMAGYLMDPFYDTAAGRAFAGTNFGLSPQINQWVSNALTCTSPSLSGFTVTLGAFFDDADSGDYAMSGGVEYKEGPFKEGSSSWTPPPRRTWPRSRTASSPASTAATPLTSG